MTEPAADPISLFSARYAFADWPMVSASIPRVAAGVYVVWEGETLIYCGMSGRQVERHAHRAKCGLVTRLDAHWNGKLSGDQFCVYVANRLIIPGLRVGQLEPFRDGALTLDELTRSYIRERFAFQHAVLASSKAACELEQRGRRGEIFGMKPLLNSI